jgi:hypothetical protein
LNRYLLKAFFTLALTWSSFPSYRVRRLPVTRPTVSLALPFQYWALLFSLFVVFMVVEYPVASDGKTERHEVLRA